MEELIMPPKLLTADERYSLSFDQFGRYQTIAAIINANRIVPSMNILDVGGLDGHIADFLPQDKVTILDVLPGSGDNYVQGDALHMAFEDGAFDVVMSSDTLEHISANDRVAFVAESWRVTKHLLITAAPFDTPGTAAAELRADAVYKTLTGTSYRWLEEHIANGLPSVLQLTNWINSEKLSFIRLSNNPLNEWYALLSHFFVIDVLDSPQGRKNYEQLCRAYNHTQVFTEARDDAYRQFFAIAKSAPTQPELPKPAADAINVIDLEPLAETLASYRALMHQRAKEHNHKVKVLEQELTTVRRQLQSVVNSKAWKVATQIHQIRAKLWPK